MATANYSLYDNIDPGSLSDAASSLSKALTPTRTELSTFKGSLNDSIWKADAKATLTDALGKIDTEVYTPLLADLGKAVSIAGLITTYREARETARANIGYLESATEKTPQSSIDGWEKAKANAEKTMIDCESSIDGLLGK